MSTAEKRVEVTGGLALLEGLSVSAADTIMVVVAHPDDETIAIGGILPELSHVVMVHATDGAPRDMVDVRRCGFETREAYARARRQELGLAMEQAGVRLEALVNLGLVDQEAALSLAPLTRRLLELIDRSAPAAIFTH